MQKYKIQLNDKSYYIYAESQEQAVRKLRDAQAKRISDMALSRADAMDRCISLGKRFIEHFDKVYKEPNSQARSHWAGEMQGWLNSVRQIKLKTTNDAILDGDLRDWFFTAGANPQDFMTSPTSEELKAYDKFTTSVINGNSVVNALNSVGIKDELIQSGSEEAFKKNIATEIKAGKDPKQAAAIAYNIQRENDSKVKDMPKGVFNRYFAVSNGASETYKSREEMMKDLHTFGDDEVYVYSLKNEKDIQNLGSEDFMFVYKEGKIIKKGPMKRDSAIKDKSIADAKLVIPMRTARENLPDIDEDLHWYNTRYGSLDFDKNDSYLTIVGSQSDLDKFVKQYHLNDSRINWEVNDSNNTEPKNWVYVMYGANNKEYKVENLTRVEAEHLLKNNKLLGFEGKIFENIRNNDMNNTNKMLDSDIVVVRSIDDLISKIKSWNGETTTNYIYSPKSSGWYFDYFITMGHKYSYYAYIKKTAHGRHDNPNVDISRQNIDKTVTAKTAQELIDQVVRILK